MIILPGGPLAPALSVAIAVPTAMVVGVLLNAVSVLGAIVVSVIAFAYAGYLWRSGTDPSSG